MSMSISSWLLRKQWNSWWKRLHRLVVSITIQQRVCWQKSIWQRLVLPVLWMQTTWARLHLMPRMLLTILVVHSLRTMATSGNCQSHSTQRALLHGVGRLVLTGQARTLSRVTLPLRVWMSLAMYGEAGTVVPLTFRRLSVSSFFRTIQMHGSTISILFWRLQCSFQASPTITCGQIMVASTTWSLYMTKTIMRQQQVHYSLLLVPTLLSTCMAIQPTT